MAGCSSPGEGQPSAAKPAVNRAPRFPNVTVRRSPARGLCLAHHPEEKRKLKPALGGKTLLPNQLSSPGFPEVPLALPPSDTVTRRSCRAARWHLPSCPRRVRRPCPRVPRLSRPLGERAFPSASPHAARFVTTLPQKIKRMR